MRAKISLLVLAGSVFRLLFLIAVAVLATQYLQDIFSEEMSDLHIITVLGSWVLMFIGGVIPLIVKICSLKENELCITDQRVFGKKGNIKKQTLDVPLSKIDSVAVNTTFWGAIFNYSTIIIKTNTNKFEYSLIKNAQKFKNELMQAIEIKKEQEIKEQAQAMFEAMCVAQSKQ